MSSRRYQAYSLLYSNNIASASKRKRINQSKFDSYQQIPFTSVDDIDDAIIKIGAKSLLKNYSQKIDKYK